MFEKIESEFQRSTAIPDEFMCQECFYIIDPDGESFRAWCTTNRPDLAALNGAPGGDLFWHCKCNNPTSAIERDRITLLMDANLPARKDQIGPRTFAKFTDVPGTPEMVSACLEWCDGKGPSTLVLIGISGAGKSHLLEASVRSLIDINVSARYERAEVMLNQLRQTMAESSEDDIEGILRWYRSKLFLALDDIGMHKSTPWGIGYLTLMVEERIADGDRLLIATNIVDEDEMAELWGERLASRLWDINTGSVRRVLSDAEDYRTRKP